MTHPVGKKRPAEVHQQHKTNDAKKNKTEEKDLFRLFDVTIARDDLSPNCVWMHPKTAKKLFPDSDFIEKDVKVAQWIFPVKINAHLKQGTVAIHPLLYQQIAKEVLANHLALTPLTPQGQNHYSPQIEFEIKPVDLSSLSKPFLSLTKLIKICHSALLDCFYFKTGQPFFIHYEGADYQLITGDMNFHIGKTTIGFKTDTTKYAFKAETLELTLNAKEPENVELKFSISVKKLSSQRPKNPEALDIFNLAPEEENDADKKGETSKGIPPKDGIEKDKDSVSDSSESDSESDHDTDNSFDNQHEGKSHNGRLRFTTMPIPQPEVEPLVIKRSTLENYVRLALLGERVVERRIFPVDSEYFKLSAALSQVNFKNPQEKAQLNRLGLDQEFEWALKYRPDFKIDLQVTDPLIVMIEDEPVDAQEVTFLVDRHGKKSPPAWIAKDPVVAALNKTPERTFVPGIPGKLQLDGGTFSLQVIHASGKEEENNSSKSLKKQWTLSPETVVSLKTASGSPIQVIDSSESAPLAKITIEVGQGQQKSGMGLRGFFMPEDETETVIETELLEKLLREEVRKENTPVIAKQTIKVDYLKKILPLTITKLEFTPGSPDVKLGPITDETKIEFKVDPKSSIILKGAASKTGHLSTGDIEANLKKIPLGGVSKQIEDLVRNIARYHDPLFAEVFKMYGIQKPPKGILFYGPPGSGKTEIAKHLGEIFGCTGDKQFQLITSSELLDMWFGNSEKKIRALFEPAEKAAEDAKKQGQKPPLHIIVIDEIDTIAPKRSEMRDDNPMKGVLNQLLGKLDGLKEIDNILFIGMTNTPDQLDPALLRPGRLDVKIHLGPPDAKGREEVFEVYLKPLRESKRLSDDFTLEQLVHQSEGMTGVFIKSVVARAISFAVERLAKIPASNDTALTLDDYSNSSLGKVGMDDFKHAMRDVLEENRIGVRR